MIVIFGGDNLKSFFSIEKSNIDNLYDLNAALKKLLDPKKFIIKEDIGSIVFEEIELVKWESFISELRYWFEKNQKRIKYIKYTFSTGRNHHSAHFNVSKKDFLNILNYIKKINVNEIDQFWLYEKPNQKMNI